MVKSNAANIKKKKINFSASGIDSDSSMEDFEYS